MTVESHRIAELEAELTRRAQSEAELRDELKTWRAEAESREAFKAYVHKRLDDAGVPTNPEPEANAKHGCRIEGRLNYLLAALERARSEGNEMARSWIPPFTARRAVDDAVAAHARAWREQVGALAAQLAALTKSVRDSCSRVPLCAEIAPAPTPARVFYSDLVQDRAATHRCKVCGALWEACRGEACNGAGMPGFRHWHLRSPKAGPCCDNVEMGEQIEPLPDAKPSEPCATCGNEARALPGRRGLTCTLPRGHDGKHSRDFGDLFTWADGEVPSYRGPGALW